MRKEITEKLIVLGVDGFEPSLAKKFMDKGKMPNLKKFVDRGAAREDLVLLGGMPTVTPPMWTTLSTGANPVTHGISAFFQPNPEKLDTVVYALDSRLCKAEQLWDVLAQQGKKTLVWHWPGSSWPPTSDSPNLSVVDGTQPGAVNMGVGIIDWEKIAVASSEFEEVKFLSHTKNQAGAGCVITDQEDYVQEDEVSGAEALLIQAGAIKEFALISPTIYHTEINVLGDVNLDIINSPIKDPIGWENAPEGAKEFTMITSSGLTRRPCLILKNKDGQYDRVAVYKSKKEETPIVILENDTYTSGIYDDIKVGEETKLGIRSMRLLELKPDGTYLRCWMSMAQSVNQDAVFHPKELLKDILDNVGAVLPICTATGKNTEFVRKLMVPSWDYYSQWQADCLTYFMDNNKFDVIFSHLHNVDLMGHQIWHFAKHREEWGNDEAIYQQVFEDIYVQTDKYLERFLKYLDEDWSIVIVSDHGLITEENHPPLLTEVSVSVPVMNELGFTYLKEGTSGKNVEIDWTKTKAISSRNGHIMLNIKGRNPEGIVDPKDQYKLEEEIITALYNYRDPKTGRRTVALALRNKDAVVLGMGGPNCGDIVFFLEEGFNIIHADSLSTQKGYFDTSVSPIFVAAGKGIKEGYKIERIIRSIDVTPSIAVLTGSRMPAQCEGGPIYQMFKEEV